MLSLSTINHNGGSRTYYNVLAKVTKITDERHWKNLWIKTTKKIYLEIISVPVASFRNAFDDQINFPKSLIVHDFDGDLNLITGELLSMNIGYADSDQQYWHGVNAFSASILRNNEELSLI